MDRCCGNCRWYAITLNRKRGGTIGECEFPLPDAAEICDTSLTDADGVNCPCFAENDRKFGTFAIAYRLTATPDGKVSVESTCKPIV